MLVLDGRACKLHRNLEQHTAIEREEGLIPWNGHADHLIDRFDGRAMLDMYREPAPNLRDKPKTAEESKLELVRQIRRSGELVAALAKELVQRSTVEMILPCLMAVSFQALVHVHVIVMPPHLKELHAPVLMTEINTPCMHLTGDKMHSFVVLQHLCQDSQSQTDCEPP